MCAGGGGQVWMTLTGAGLASSTPRNEALLTVPSSRSTGASERRSSTRRVPAPGSPFPAGHLPKDVAIGDMNNDATSI